MMIALKLIRVRICCVVVYILHFCNGVILVKFGDLDIIFWDRMGKGINFGGGTSNLLICIDY